jgi:hypothetical protein
MRRHSERFMAALWDYKNLLPREEYLRYYFFDVPVTFYTFRYLPSSSECANWRV